MDIMHVVCRKAESHVVPRLRGLMMTHRSSQWDVAGSAATDSRHRHQSCDILFKIRTASCLSSI